jgi:hypothetical protein
VQIMYTHVSKCKNDTCWNCSKNRGGGVNSNIIYLIHCKNLCKYSSVPPPSTTIIIIKQKQVKKVNFQLVPYPLLWNSVSCPVLSPLHKSKNYHNISPLQGIRLKEKEDHLTFIWRKYWQNIHQTIMVFLSGRWEAYLSMENFLVYPHFA